MLNTQKLLIYFALCNQTLSCEADIAFPNKLVRDKIPEIIKNNGRMCTTYTIEGEEHKKRLLEKLEEEIAEFTLNPCLEEIADILEVLHSICYTYNLPFNEVEEVRKQKLQTNGSFEKGIVLFSLEELMKP